MTYNHSKLRGKIKEVIGSEVKFAKLLGISQATLSAKLNNKSDFTRAQILMITEKLNLSQEEFYDVFFLKN
ncbi:toxin-antitoxin system, antitoxin component, Xre family [Fusobacterium necrophorum subsp. funduliforme ATCC 51357]|uniref:DUF739 family protein n=1 Tax=Fusobacterium necrophorum TaxID=859 RepID=UPI00025E6B0C|nr:DUF739 family protein [Fusobacterium necrophorum]EIJ70668.1 toxin-antitoxin system, antitoxin component, Xre family [Fusobacterium necrophorum subsp. funduliforme ATCC 51357]KYM52836.1 hypothetical protein A2U06_02685 [Fusobacterium necrophorum subsp. funduliforme]KYM59782.1 hypothetical protein A2U09_04875 [Fusobacterium necrophorum subsp. funduliforme]MDK4472267.1 DUF739 family protein [Fusobacterium necrophorum]MDK4479515.1 DUF739 family protein [Fusobacterium necrophorum]